MVSKLFLRIIHPPECISLRCNTSPQSWRAQSILKTEIYGGKNIYSIKMQRAKATAVFMCWHTTMAQPEQPEPGSPSDQLLPQISQCLLLNGQCSAYQVTELPSRTLATQPALVMLRVTGHSNDNPSLSITRWSSGWIQSWGTRGAYLVRWQLGALLQWLGSLNNSI